jgi:tRNA nucleotidyltransferase/poly(A) polymerase
MTTPIIDNLKKEPWIIGLHKYTNIYIVGGCVRDSLMNQSMKDIDLIVEGLSLNGVKDILNSYGNVDIVGQSFSVLKFKPIGYNGEAYDIAVPRIDIKTGDGHKGFEVKTEGIGVLEDLKRRDFTINSIAINIFTNEILDPFNGVEDIKNKIIRATDPSAFIEDPLRILRAVQFASRFRMNIEPTTLSLMKSHSHLIIKISSERILSEFDKIILKKGSTKIAFQVMWDSDLDKGLFFKKFINNDFTFLDNLDKVSFYYVLANLGNVNPYDFYKFNLKGDYHTAKALMLLDKNFDKLNYLSEEDLRWTIFQMLKVSTILLNVKIFPPKVIEVIKLMKTKVIPMQFGDIPVNGNDIISLFDVSDIRVGQIINQMYKDALMVKFNWKNKEKTILYIKKFIY